MKLIKLLPLLFLFCCDMATESRSAQTYIVITFDDAHESIYSTALPIMNEYDFYATNVINTGYIGGEDKLSWQEVEELEFEYGWETAGHTLHHISMPNNPIEIVEYEIYQDWLNLQEHGLNHSTFALPGGNATEDHYEIILQYYQNVRTSRDLCLHAPLDRKNLGYFSYHTDYTAEHAIARIIKAVEYKESIVVIGFHRILDDAVGHPRNCKPDDFRKIMKFIFENGFEVITIKEACEMLS